MSKIPENPVYEESIYQLDTTDPLKGGTAVFDGDSEATNGFLNAGTQQLTNRTAYLKLTLDNHIGSGDSAHAVVTNASNGFMSAADKTKLDGITAGAQPQAVTSVAGKTGAVTLVKADVGLGNVDNTSDANKPVSTAQQTALNLKANLASPTFTGTPSAPTAIAGTNTTQIATTAFVTAAVGAVTSTVTSVAGRTGDVVLTKSDVGLANVDNTSDTNKPVSTAQQTALNLKANLASPTLTGTPTAPTAAVGTNTTQIATTAFVLANSNTSSQNLLQIQEQQPTNTTAGTPAAAATYTKRTLNTVVINEISGTSLSNSVITLPAGTYYIEGSSPFVQTVGPSRIRLRNTADNTTTIIGENTGSNSANLTTRSAITGKFTITATKTFEVQYYVTNATSGGLGQQVGITGEVEVYSDVRIWKLS